MQSNNKTNRIRGIIVKGVRDSARLADVRASAGKDVLDNAEASQDKTVTVLDPAVELSNGVSINSVNDLSKANFKRYLEESTGIILSSTFDVSFNDYDLVTDADRAVNTGYVDFAKQYMILAGVSRESIIKYMMLLVQVMDDTYPGFANDFRGICRIFGMSGGGSTALFKVSQDAEFISKYSIGDVCRIVLVYIINQVRARVVTNTNANLKAYEYSNISLDARPVIDHFKKVISALEELSRKDPEMKTQPFGGQYLSVANLQRYGSGLNVALRLKNLPKTSLPDTEAINWIDEISSKQGINCQLMSYWAIALQTLESTAGPMPFLRISTPIIIPEVWLYFNLMEKFKDKISILFNADYEIVQQNMAAWSWVLMLIRSVELARKATKGEDLSQNTSVANYSTWKAYCRKYAVLKFFDPITRKDLFSFMVNYMVDYQKPMDKTAILDQMSTLKADYTKALSKVISAKTTEEITVAQTKTDIKEKPFMSQSNVNPVESFNLGSRSGGNDLKASLINKFVANMVEVAPEFNYMFSRSMLDNFDTSSDAKERELKDALAAISSYFTRNLVKANNDPRHDFNLNDVKLDPDVFTSTIKEATNVSDYSEAKAVVDAQARKRPAAGGSRPTTPTKNVGVKLSDPKDK